MARISPAQPVNTDNEGNIISLHLGSNAANDDWIRAKRLLQEGREEEYRELDNEKMVRVIPDENEF